MANCRARSPLEQMLLDGSKPIDDTQDPLAAYEVVSAVGRGKFSTVYRAKRLRDNQTVALKKIDVGKKPNRHESIIRKNHSKSSCVHPISQLFVCVFLVFLSFAKMS